MFFFEIISQTYPRISKIFCKFLSAKVLGLKVLTCKFALQLANNFQSYHKWWAPTKNKISWYYIIFLTSKVQLDQYTSLRNFGAKIASLWNLITVAQIDQCGPNGYIIFFFRFHGSGFSTLEWSTKQKKTICQHRWVWNSFFAFKIRKNLRSWISMICMMCISNVCIGLFFQELDKNFKECLYQDIKRSECHSEGRNGLFLGSLLFTFDSVMLYLYSRYTI